MKILDVVALLLILVKAAELFLRPHQQRMLQDWVETAALRLAELRGDAWARLVFHSTGVQIAIVVLWPLVLFLEMRRGLQLARTPDYGEVVKQIGSNLEPGAPLPFVACAVWLPLALTIRVWSKRLGDWILDRFSWRRLLRKYATCLLAVVGLTASMFLWSGVGLAVGPAFDGNAGTFYLSLAVFAMVGWALSCAGFVAITAQFSCAAVMTFSGMAACSRLLLSALRFVTWGIAEHSRGAWSGLVTLLTVLLLLIEFAVRACAK